MEEWKEYKLGDILADKGYIRGPFGSALKRGDMKSEGIPVYEQQHAIYQMRDFRFFIDDKKFQEMKRFQVNENDLVISCSGTVGKVTIISKDDPKGIISQALLILRVNPNIILPKYLQYFFISSKGYNSIISRSSGSVQVNIAKRDVIESIPLSLPPLPTQQKIAAILSSLDDKIELNNKINTNLEQQAQALFKNTFANKIDNVSEKDGKPLGTLIDIVDNRGKTPPSSNEKNDFPILDVGVLNSTGRIIDYKNCTKYVDEQTYNTFFRDGHPQENDILISTVGSLAQMKFFKGDKGCIAQNVVAFRTLNTSPFYLYEYLKYIKNDLLAYDIGSVQPSIKVTHIIKHLIYIPTNDELSNFDSFAKSITEQIFNNVCENERLISLRDTLLPKLMNGEIETNSNIISMEE